jgi:hypothetical protein
MEMPTEVIKPTVIRLCEEECLPKNEHQAFTLPASRISFSGGAFD